MEILFLKNVKNGKKSLNLQLREPHPLFTETITDTKGFGK